MPTIRKDTSGPWGSVIAVWLCTSVGLYEENRNRSPTLSPSCCASDSPMVSSSTASQVGGAARDDARSVDDATEPRVDLRGSGEERAVRRHEGELVQLRDLGNAGRAPELVDLGLRGVAGVDLDVGRPARLLEACQRALRATRTGDQREDDCPRETHEQGEHDDAAPPTT